MLASACPGGCGNQLPVRNRGRGLLPAENGSNLLGVLLSAYGGVVLLCCWGVAVSRCEAESEMTCTAQDVLWLRCGCLCDIFGCWSSVQPCLTPVGRHGHSAVLERWKGISLVQKCIFVLVTIGEGEIHTMRCSPFLLFLPEHRPLFFLV